jgi:hypothetical protein
VGIVGPDGVLSYRKVAIARDFGDRVTTTAGVTDGEKAALNLPTGVADGTTVAPVAVKSQ